MEILIHPEKKLKEIQADFHHLFPFLKIEFFQKAHEVGAPSALSLKLDPELTLSGAGKFEGEKKLKITGKMTAGQLESGFQENFGIGLQVFRKAGNAWILTTLSDDWTLEHQNEEGKNDAKSFSEKTEVVDFDPTDDR